MPKPVSEMSQHEINDFCRATSAVYYSILHAHAQRTGTPAMVPDLLCPRGRVPRIHQFDEATLDEAERFLLRMGFICEW